MNNNGMTTIEAVREQYNKFYPQLVSTFDKVEWKCWLNYSESRNRNGNPPMTLENYSNHMGRVFYAEQVNVAEQMGVKVCPVLETFIFTTREDLMERVNKYLDIVDPIGKTHINEGVVIRILGKERFSVYKHKGVYFKILEGLIKSDATEPDMEESEE